MTLRPESDADHAAVRRLHRSAFPSPAEANLVDALRREGCVRASLVVSEGGDIVGHILFSTLRIVREGVPVAMGVALAPVAVRPDRQRQGIGTALVRAGLDACRIAGEPFVIVLGEPAFYGRFGFRADLARPLTSPYAGPYFQALELSPGALTGITGNVEYAPPFADLE